MLSLTPEIKVLLHTDAFDLDPSHLYPTEGKKIIPKVLVTITLLPDTWALIF